MVVEWVNAVNLYAVRPCNADGSMIKGQDCLGVHNHAPQLSVNIISFLGVGSKNTLINQILNLLPVECVFIIFIAESKSLNFI